MPSTNMGYWDMCQRIRITTITTTMTGAHRATKVGLHNAIWNAHYTVYHGHGYIVHNRLDKHTLCLRKKTCQVWNGIAQNYKDRLWWHLAKIFKILQNRVCMLQFSCRFAFVNYSTFQTGHRKITQILKVTPHTACQHGTIQ